MEQTVIEGNLSGMWYPKDQEVLKTFLKEKEQKIPPLKERKVKAMILPHAGYQYSAENALYALSALKGNEQNYSKIIILGPTHRHSFFNKFLISKAHFYKTPFGKIEIDQDSVKTLQKKYPDLLLENDDYFKEEHSIDNEIPLLHYAVGVERFKENHIKILPIMISHFDEKQLNIMTAALREIIDEKTLLVVSSDFTHHGKNFDYTPFAGLKNPSEVEEKLMKLDLTAGEFARLGQGKEFIEFISLTKATICGAFPIYLLLNLLPNSLHGEIVKYDTSARLTNSNFDSSVSYLSIIYSGKWQEENTITQDEKKELLIVARMAIENAIKERKILKPSDPIIHLSPFMEQKGAAFVTLKKEGELRGCIGEILPTRPLINVIIERAIDAAVNDTRFNPVAISELNNLDIEITLLTPPQNVNSYSEIKLGVDGIILIKDSKSAVFLPQVAIEQHWDLKTTLSQLSLKAGLSSNAWENGARFQTFQGIIFSEHDFK